MNWKPIKQYRDRQFPDRERAALFDRWEDGKEITRYAAGVSGLDWARILRSGRLSWLAGEPDDPPELDHAFLFRSHGGRVWLVYQPYAEPGNIRRTAEEWAETHGLLAEIYGPAESWYSGDTCLVVITAGPRREVNEE